MTVGDQRRERLKKLGAEVKAVGHLMEVLQDVSNERLKAVSDDLFGIAQRIGRIYH